MHAAAFWSVWCFAGFWGRGRRKGVPDWWSREWQTGFMQVYAGSWWNKVVWTLPVVDLVKSERMYTGVSPLHTLNMITALLHFSCFLSPQAHLHVVGMLLSLPTPFTLFLCLFLSCGPFICISFHKFSRQLSVFSLCSPSLYLPYWSFQLYISF